MIRIAVFCLLAFACATLGMCGDNCQQGALDSVRDVREVVAPELTPPPAPRIKPNVAAGEPTISQ